MQNLSQQILEVTSIPTKYSKSTFYFGVSTAKQAKTIWNKKAIPVYKGKKGFGTRSYLTDKVQDACRHAGTNLGVKTLRQGIKSGGRYGYIFQIPKESLYDIFPNESDIGRFIQEIYEYQYRTKEIDHESLVYLSWVWSILERKEQQAIMYDVSGAYHSIGKKVLEKMSDKQILWVLNQRDIRITHEGEVEFDTLFGLDRLLTSDVSEDGSDFFRYAKKVTSVKDII